MAKVSTGGSSLEDRELIALAGNDTVISPVTLCLKIQVKITVRCTVCTSRLKTPKIKGCSNELNMFGPHNNGTLLVSWLNTVENDQLHW